MTSCKVDVKNFLLVLKTSISKVIVSFDDFNCPDLRDFQKYIDDFPKPISANDLQQKIEASGKKCLILTFRKDLKAVCGTAFFLIHYTPPKDDV